MLKFSVREKKILDGLLTKSPKKVAEDLHIDVETVYYTKNYFKRKVQNAEEFLAVAKSKYAPLLRRRLNTPKIMPEDVDEDEDLLFRKHNKR